MTEGRGGGGREQKRRGREPEGAGGRKREGGTAAGDGDQRRPKPGLSRRSRDRARPQGSEGGALEIVRGGETEEESRRRGEGESRAG